MLKPWIFILFLIPYNGLSQARLTNKQVYDFNIGDEFHYKVNFSSVASEGYKYTILGKKILNDSITYTMMYDSYKQRFEYTFDSEIRTITITDLDSFIDDLYQISLNKEDTCFSDTFFFSEKLKVPVYTYTYSTCSFEASTTIEEFGVGLGKTEYEHRDPTGPFYFWHVMRYYKKGAITFGSPDKAYELGIKNFQMESINVYPNPAKDELYLVGNFKSFFGIQIMDCFGRIVNPKMITSSKIDISTLSPGIYYLIFYEKGYQYTGKFIKN